MGRAMGDTRLVSSLEDELEGGPHGEQSSDTSRRLLIALGRIWKSLKRSDDTGMTADKLSRAEKVTWAPPVLSFTIERHGAYVLGSSRAELHRWEANLENNTATCAWRSWRQLDPLAPRLNVKPIARSVCEAVQAGPHGEPRNYLIWKRADEVQVKQGKLIPGHGPMQTVSGRRRRFRQALIEQMREIGWVNEPSGRWISFRREVPKRDWHSGRSGGLK